MSGDNQKTEQQPEVKGAAANTTHGPDQYADRCIRTRDGRYTGITDNEAVLVKMFRRVQRETGVTAVPFHMFPVTEVDSKEFKKKVVEHRMVANLGLALENGKKEGPSEDQNLEAKANSNTKNE